MYKETITIDQYAEFIAKIPRSPDITIFITIFSLIIKTIKVLES